MEPVAAQGNQNHRENTQKTWSTRRKMAEAYCAHLTGFGNTIRFSALLRENEVSLLIPIAMSLTFFGIPLAFLEVGLGHYTLKNVVHVWKMCPMAKGIFYVIFLTTLLMVLNMLIFLCYAMHYFVSFWGSELPWARCSAPWAKENCFDAQKNVSLNATCKDDGAEYCDEPVWEVSSLHYWKNAVLKNPDSFTIGFLNWNMLLYLFTICFIITLVNRKGIQSLEKFNAFFAYLPIACLTILIIMILRLPGAVKYTQAFWSFNVTKLKSPSVWLGAVDVTFLSLSLGTLGLSFISSHGNFHDDILIDVVIVCFLDFISSVFFGFFVFGLKGSLLYREEIKKGVELLPGDYTNFHVWISQALINNNQYEKTITFIFYFNVIFSGIGPMSYQVAAIMSAITGIFKSVRNHMFYLSFGVFCVLYVLAVIIFMTIGINLPSIENSLIATVFLQAVIIQLFYGCHNIADDFHFMMGYRPSIFFRVPWALSPIILGVILYVRIFNFENSQQVITQWILIGAPFAIHLISSLVDIFLINKKQKLKNFWILFKKDSTWGPSAAILKKSRIIFTSQTVTKEYMYRQELVKKPDEKPFDFSKQNIVQQL